MSDFKMPDIGNLMKAAQKIQADMAKMQSDLAKLTVDATAGGGMVTAVVNGHFEIVKLDIQKDAIDPADPAMLQDLVIAAVNQAVAKVREKTQAEMAKLTGGLNIPGLPGLPGL